MEGSEANALSGSTRLSILHQEVISKCINEMTPAQRGETINRLLQRNPHLYNSYCEGVGNQTNDIAVEVQD